MRVDRPETLVGYKEAHVALGLDLKGLTHGISLNRQGMDSLAYWTRDHGFPAVSGLIVSRGTNRPSDGHFEFYGKSHDDTAWWQRELDRAAKFNWEPYL